ncbi:MAG: TIGR00159 family protein [Planctomycetes bacterium]|nr:TIGR00159 family protein [Planctomycetota bacterium]
MLITALLKLALEVVVVAALVYAFIRFLQDTRGSGVMRGFVLALLIMGALFLTVVKLLGLEHLAYIADQGLPLLLITLVVVFQPEIRQALVRLGESRLLRRSSSQRRDRVGVAAEVSQAAERLARRGLGGLILIERSTGIAGFAEGATRLDALVSAALLVSIFSKDAPLHDGAVIVRGERIVAAGCLLPLSENPNLPRALGTRHRAAVGATEETDAIAVVISEETQRIALVLRGRIEEDVTPERLRKVLETEGLEDSALGGAPRTA